MDEKQKPDTKHVPRRNADRREEQDPNYIGPERRAGERRTTH